MRSSESVPIEVVTTETLSKLSVKDLPHSLQYLEKLDFEKPASSRMLSWMVQFKLLPEKAGEWAPKLTSLVKSYNALVEKHCSGYSLDKIKESLPAIIPRDLGRSKVLFDRIFEGLELDKKFFDDSDLRIHRIFLVIQATAEGFEYLQGFDRFIYIMAAVATAFCAKVGLSSSYCEAFTFHMTKYALTKLAWSKLVFDQTEANDIYFEIMEILRRAYPATAAALNSQQLRPEMFALNWLLLLFAEQHPIDELLLVWDLIFRNIGDYHEYVLALLVAHLNQIQIGLNTTDTMQRLMKTNSFDMTRLVKDVEKITNKKPVVVTTNERSGGIPPGIVIVSLLALVAVGAFILYRGLK